jgi:dCMP deaminase
MQITELVSCRSTCIRRRVGAVVVKGRHILATGYNGAPSGIRHCIETGCLREQMGVPAGQRHEICRGLHAEQNAIIQAAAHGVSIDGADLYTTTMPCIICTKMILNAGIARVYYIEGYPDELTGAFFEEAGIPLKQLNRKKPEGSS